MAIWAALERRWRMYVVFVVLSLLVKEDVSLIIVPLGIWVAVKRDRRIGLLTIAGSLAFMAVAMLRRDALADRRADAQRVAGAVRRTRRAAAHDVRAPG